jgi:F-type H+-transporting ATPase subunit c
MSTQTKLSAASAALVTVFASSAVLAQTAAAAERNDGAWAPAIGAAIAIGLAAMGGALGQGRAAAAALEGISRNPGAAARIQTPMILGLALIESLVLFAFVIAFLLQGAIAK